MNKKYAFILPTGGERPFGGFKVIYEYANRLSKNGENVFLLYSFPSANKTKKVTYNLAKKIFYFFKYSIFRNYKPKHWFILEKKIKQKLITSCNREPNQAFFSQFDYLFATGLETAYFLDKINTVPSIKKFYFIQSYETWVGVNDEYVLNSYRLPLNKIVISPFLENKVKDVGMTSILIPNGFDFNYFKLSESIDSRDMYTVSMLYHTMEVKRCIDTIEALKLVKMKHPELVVNVFGFPKRPASLPEWFHYYQKPTKEVHNKIYNDSSIFVAASRLEGMALPPAEAMICGCALVCTNIPGFTQYAIHNETALLSEVYDVQGLAQNINLLIENENLRKRLANNGNSFIKKFTWEESYKKFISFVNSFESDM